MDAPKHQGLEVAPRTNESRAASTGVITGLRLHKIWSDPLKVDRGSSPV